MTQVQQLQQLQELQVHSMALERHEPPCEMRTRKRLQVQGLVQGVGFRPFVYELALQHGLAGFVGNDSEGVFIEIEGAHDLVSQFERALVAHPPLAAHIERMQAASLPVRNEAGFAIVESHAQPESSTFISPDLALCEDCLRELLDPANRRHRYPFINCTHCGPRFTITQDIPYDRPRTTMAAFEMCEACRAEYLDPHDRRFHAQPIACPDCGPQLALVVDGAVTLHREAALQATERTLAAGGIVAIKGLGGFHLACDAGNDAAVKTLRERKGRGDKPFAVMALDLATVEQFAWVDADERALLMSREHPIVLLRKKTGSPLSALIAPGNGSVGVMLPYTPLHHLLLMDLRDQPDRQLPLPVLVMTSGNISDEPIVTDNAEAITRLGPLVDAILMHNRDIYAPCDDSVVRVFEGHELPVRRSRGYAPFPISLPFDVRPTLAVGGELKSAFCLAQGNHAFMSQHIGDMQNLETVQAFEHALQQMQALFRIRPEVIVADLHPGYLSTHWAERQAQALGGLPLIKVQHHHAHIASVMAEHGLPPTESVIGISFDGTGYGTDGAVWGGEVLIASYAAFQRVAHLKYVPLPGGDSAVTHTYRCALSHLWAAGRAWSATLPPVVACSAMEQQVLRRQLERGLNTPPTSSMGRLFDAVAALAGVRQQVAYEGQAAIELEAMADPAVRTRYAFGLRYSDPIQIDPAPVIVSVVADVIAGVPPAVIAARFHHAVADVILDVCLHQRGKTGLRRVALSGGVFQNATLLSEAVALLRKAGFEVLTHRRVPPNDGGLSLGQAVVAQFMARS